MIMKTQFIKVPIDIVYNLLCICKRLQEDIKYDCTLNDGTEVYKLQSRLYNNDPEYLDMLYKAIEAAYIETLRKRYC